MGLMSPRLPGLEPLNEDLWCRCWVVPWSQNSTMRVVNCKSDVVSIVPPQYNATASFEYRHIYEHRFTLLYCSATVSATSIDDYRPHDRLFTWLDIAFVAYARW